MEQSNQSAQPVKKSAVEHAAQELKVIGPGLTNQMDKVYKILSSQSKLNSSIGKQAKAKVKAKSYIMQLFKTVFDANRSIISLSSQNSPDDLFKILTEVTKTLSQNNKLFEYINGIFKNSQDGEVFSELDFEKINKLMLQDETIVFMHHLIIYCHIFHLILKEVGQESYKSKYEQEYLNNLNEKLKREGKSIIEKLKSEDLDELHQAVQVELKSLDHNLIIPIQYLCRFFSLFTAIEQHYPENQKNQKDYLELKSILRKFSRMISFSNNQLKIIETEEKSFFGFKKKSFTEKVQTVIEAYNNGKAEVANEMLKSTIGNANSAFDDLKSKLEETSNSEEPNVAKIEEAQQSLQLDINEYELKQQKEEIAELKKKLEQSEEKAKQGEQKLEQLKKQVEENQSMLEQLKINNNKLTNEKENLAKQLQAVSAREKELQRREQEIANQQSKLEKEKQEDQQAKALLEKLRVEKTNQLNEEKQKLAEQLKKVIENRENVSKMQQEVTKKERELVEREEQFKQQVQEQEQRVKQNQDDQGKQIEQFQVQIQELSTENNDLKSKEELQKQSEDGLKKQLNELEQKTQQFQTEKQEQIDSLTKKLESIQQKLEESEKSKTQLVSIP